MQIFVNICQYLLQIIDQFQFIWKLLPFLTTFIKNYRSTFFSIAKTELSSSLIALMVTLLHCYLIKSNFAANFSCNFLISLIARQPFEL